MSLGFPAAGLVGVMSRGLLLGWMKHRLVVEATDYRCWDCRPALGALWGWASSEAPRWAVPGLWVCSIDLVGCPTDLTNLFWMTDLAQTMMFFC